MLRLEKGHIIIGQDTDGLTHPYEADMAWAIAKSKPYLHAASNPSRSRTPRGLTRKLVGFTIDDPAAPVPEECHLTLRGDDHRRPRHLGRALASLGRVVGLAYVAPEQADARQAASTSRSMAAASSRARWRRSPSTIPKNKRQEM